MNYIIVYSVVTKITSINYSDFSQAEKNNIYIYYDYKGENNWGRTNRFISINIGDINYLFYLNNEQITQNSITKYYKINMSKAVNAFN